MCYAPTFVGGALVESPFILEQFTVMAQRSLIPTLLYKMDASMKAAIFNCQCDQMQSCEGSCEAIYDA